MARRAAPAWVLPVTVLALGAIMVVSARSQQARVEQHLERRAREHVRSVATVLIESTHQTSEAVDLAYLMVEARLHASLLRVTGAQPDLRRAVAQEEGLLVWRLRDEGGETSETGEVGPLGRDGLAEAWAEAPEELFEQAVGEGARIACLVDEHYGLRSLACISGEELSRLRARAGPGRLFADIIHPPLRYVALQDAAGLLAASPGLPSLSEFDADPYLERARTAAPGEVHFRRQADLREGLCPFELPDGSLVVLRVGLDAGLEASIHADLAGRQRLLIGLVLLAVLLASLGAWWIDRRERDRQQVQSALERAEADNEHWQMIGQLAATVAHEVRNPLNAIQMVAQRLQREFDVAEEDRAEFATLVGLVRSEGARVDEVVTEFLELGRPLALDREDADPGALLRQAVLPLQARAQTEDKRVEVDAPSGASVALDARRFVQIVDNLVRNALDAIAEGAAVHVSARVEGGALVVQVRDEGEGMDAETLAQVMDPFFTTKARGTGLGLPLARRLARAHGGDLVLTSQPGAGTQAILQIPVSRPKETP